MPPQVRDLEMEGCVSASFEEALFYCSKIVLAVKAGVVEECLEFLASRYHERFEFVRGVRPGQVHLFLVKNGLWSLAWTFIPKHFEDEGLGVGVEQAARLVLEWLGEGSEMGVRLDSSIRAAIARVERRSGVGGRGGRDDLIL